MIFRLSKWLIGLKISFLLVVERPTYDDLTITQWVSGFVRCIQEEKLDAAKECMLDYLGNLMEDTSDFSWEAAKAFHAIALTNMEADRLKWTDTDKLDRIRRAHAQRHC